MAVPKEDWIKDTVWIEFHLTPTGWLRGTKRTEKGRFENEIEPPIDRLMTVRCLECVPDDATIKPTAKSEIRWRIDDVQYIEKAQSDWGVLPRDAPPLSAEAVARHRPLKNLLTMQLSELRRPLGTRIKKRPEWANWSRSVF